MMSIEAQPSMAAPELMSRVRAFIESQGSGGDFNELALALFAWQFQNVAIYRQFCERRRRGPDDVKHWTEIPALPVSAFKEHIVSSIPEPGRARVFHSSGTSAQIPSRHFHSAESLALYEASLRPWFERHFPGDSQLEQMIFLAPPPSQAPHSSLVHMFQTVAGENGLFLGVLAQDGAWALDLERLTELPRRPVGILGAAFSFVHWLDHLAEKKIRLRLAPGSRLLETGGYKGRSRAVPKAELHQLMTKYLGVPASNIITEYGMSELGSQAYSCGGVFHFPPWARAQVVSAETDRLAAEGETGLLRIFDLTNVCSVMALQTEDLAIRRGDGFELLGRAENAEPRGCSLMAAA